MIDILQKTDKIVSRMAISCSRGMLSQIGCSAAAVCFGSNSVAKVGYWCLFLNIPPSGFFGGADIADSIARICENTQYLWP